MQTLWQDLRFAWRMLAKNPGYTVVVVLILALSIGANTALFTIVDAWLVRPLPFKEPAALVAIWKSEVKNPRVPSIFAYQRDYQEWLEQSQSFESLAGFYLLPYTLAGQGEPKDILGQPVTQNLFSTLGVTAAQGRTFAPDDLRGQPVVILSHELWQHQFGGAPEVLGKALTLNDKSYAVIGVMPPRFTLPSIFQPNTLEICWTLIRPDTEPLFGQSQQSLAVIGRLRRGVTAARAEAELEVIQQRLDQKLPPRAETRDYRVIATNMQEDVTREMRPTLLALTGAVTLVLLIACANVASLLLGRMTERQQELAVRAAVGAGRGRLVRQLLTESVLLSLFGAACGLALAQVALRYFLSLDPFEKLPFNEIAINYRVLCFTASLTFLTGALFGIIPALQAARLNVNELLKDVGRGSSPGVRSRRVHSLLVCAETALSLALLIGAGLLGKSFARLVTEPRGFDAEHALLLSLKLPKQDYTEAEQANDLYDRLLERLRGLPGVQAVGATTNPPIYTGGLHQFVIEGSAAAAPEAAAQYAISPDYFAAAGIRLVKGRHFDERDRERAENVSIINEALARRCFPDAEALGKRLKLGAPNSQAVWRTIVGVVGDTKYNLYGNLGWRVSPMTYLPQRQAPVEASGSRARNRYLLIRTAHAPAQLVATARAAVQAVDQNLRLDEIKPLADELFRETKQPRLRTTLLGGFAALALLLAAIGIYGVVSQAVLQRRHEIGVRLALGAQAGDILRLVVRQGMTPVVIGLLIGLSAAYSLTRLLAGLLYGVGAHDPATFVAVTLWLSAVALVACYLPARRAAQVDPLIALRHE